MKSIIKPKIFSIKSDIYTQTLRERNNCVYFLGKVDISFCIEHKIYHSPPHDLLDLLNLDSCDPKKKKSAINIMCKK